MTTTPHAELPAHMVFIDQYDDSTFGSITDDAWGRDESSELKLGAPLYTAGQMRAYADARERALLARLGEQQPVAQRGGVAPEDGQYWYKEREGARRWVITRLHGGYEFADDREWAGPLREPGAHPPAAQPVAQGEREAAEWWHQHWDDLRYMCRVLESASPTRADLEACHRLALAWRQAVWQHGKDAADGASRSSAQGAAQVPQWTSVHDALPQCSDDEDVLVWTWDGIAVTEDVYGPTFEQPAGPTAGGWVSVGYGFAGDTMGCVTHWMLRPRPAAPHGEGER